MASAIPDERSLTIILILFSISTQQQTQRVVLMYVCLCQGVTDGQIREAIYEGCCSYREVREATGVATQCGKCACLAKQVVRETLSNAQSAQASLAHPAGFVLA
jgi:bacterioferritin-associated ferredoxin